MKILLVPVLLCVCASQSVFAQGVEMPQRSCRECVITKEYDAPKDRTKVLLKQMPVAEVPGGTMYIALGTHYYGGHYKSVYNKVVYVTVTFIAKPLFEAKDTELKALADEKPITFGKLTLSVTDSKRDRKISIYMGMSGREDVLKLGQAKKVRMSLDGIEFQLTDEHRAAILDFLAYGDGDPGSDTDSP
ncbi:MAG TPA: hypothetical protein VIG25_13965 [Pyrinomonadaceae bacterium]|jgi:hypothetical protein